MSYERYKDYRFIPDDNGCVSVVTGDTYEQRGTFPSKAAAKRWIDNETTPTQPSNSLEEILIKWWHETNGTGTDACSKCKGDYICTWHIARLVELKEYVAQEVLKGKIEALEELKRRWQSDRPLMDYSPATYDFIADKLIIELKKGKD